MAIAASILLHQIFDLWKGTLGAGAEPQSNRLILAR
jgi:hypothetical protein